MILRLGSLLLVLYGLGFAWFGVTLGKPAPAAGGKTDGDSLIAAAKGMKWDSPRGPMSIDPETRDVVQTIFIRKVEKVDGQPQNVAFDKIENVKDPAGARRK